MTKSQIIVELAKRSQTDRHSLLLDLLDFTRKQGLKDITEQEAQQYYTEKGYAMNAPDLFMELMKDKISPEFISWLEENRFFTAPASTKYHGAYEGGLFQHARIVTEVLVELTKNNNLEWENPNSPYIVGMFHDLCKVDCYKINSLTKEYEYNTDTIFTGHGDKSVMLLAQHIQLTEEEALCIRYHMGAFTDKEEWKYYNKAIEKYPNVLWTHTADMIVAKLFRT